MNGRMDGWVGRRKEGKKDRQMDRWIDIWMEQWRNGEMNERRMIIWASEVKEGGMDILVGRCMIDKRMDG